MHKRIISASILSADFAYLGEEVERVLAAGVDYIHFDVMDYHFVPNLTFGALICHALRKAGIKAPIDVHLMVDHPENFIQPFADAGASLITFHPETVKNVEHLLVQIQKSHLQTGVAFNPDQAITTPNEILKAVDLVLLMSVKPGFSGQSFMPGSLEKIAQARQLLDEIKSKAFLGIDGGIKLSNMGETARAGADFFVVGSGLFHTSNYRKTVEEMRKNISF